MKENKTLNWRYLIIAWVMLTLGFFAVLQNLLWVAAIAATLSGQFLYKRHQFQPGQFEDGAKAKRFAQHLFVLIVSVVALRAFWYGVEQFEHIPNWINPVTSIFVLAGIVIVWSRSRARRKAAVMENSKQCEVE